MFEGATARAPMQGAGRRIISAILAVASLIVTIGVGVGIETPAAGAATSTTVGEMAGFAPGAPIIWGYGNAIPGSSACSPAPRTASTS